ncbi:unnamed protein product [Microthlaspi erraticum]|uniref:Arabidopsis retrotransposon Orf1 C-terminal domain-containing protein n=1 Tax=Microthlaspi erraticum TaxID=1685480 RepID=A0A6D2KK37_9BRAS|nr:unnamed protein product [Microthlaspi erraticum]
MGRNHWDIKENELQSVWATIAEEGFSSSRSKAAQIRSPVLRYVHKALANTFFARKATGTINEGEVKLLDMGIKPIISRTVMGRSSEEIVHAGNLMPLLEELLSYKTTAYSTRFQQGINLSVGGIITPILCAAGVQLNKKKSTPAGWMDIQFCKTNLLIDHKEVNGKYQFKFTHPTAGPSKLLLPNPELTTVIMGENIDFRPPLYTLVGHEDDLREEEPELDRAEDRVVDRAEMNEDLGEPDCYYFEEYEAPRMNPYVVAAHKRIGLLQKFNKWQGKAIEKMQKSMDKMELILLTTPRRLPAQEPRHLNQGKKETTRRGGGRVPRPDALTRPVDSIESKQRKLNSVELMVELILRGQNSKTLDLGTIRHLTRTTHRATGTHTARLSNPSSTRAKEATHALRKKKRSRKLDRAA